MPVVPTLIVPEVSGAREVTLRPLTARDRDALQVMVDDPEIRAAMHWSDGLGRSAERFIESTLTQDDLPVRELYPFGIVVDLASELAGLVMVKLGRKIPETFPPAVQAELQIFLKADHRKQGYGLRILTRARDWCLDELAVPGIFGGRAPISEVIAGCLLDNVGSQAVLRKVLREREVVQAPSGANGERVLVLLFGLNVVSSPGPLRNE